MNRKVTKVRWNRIYGHAYGVRLTLINKGNDIHDVFDISTLTFVQRNATRKEVMRIVQQAWDRKNSNPELVKLNG